MQCSLVVPERDDHLTPSSRKAQRALCATTVPQSLWLGCIDAFGRRVSVTGCGLWFGQQMSITQRYMPDLGHNIWKRDSRSVDSVLILRVEHCGTSLSRFKADICELAGYCL